MLIAFLFTGTNLMTIQGQSFYWKFPIQGQSIVKDLINSSYGCRDESPTGYDYDFHAGMDLAK